MEPDFDTLYDLYIVQRLTVREIAQQLGFASKTSIQNRLKALNIPRRPANHGMVHQGIAPPTREEMQRLIHVEHLGYREIAVLLGIHSGSIRHWVNKYGITPAQVWDTRTRGMRPTLPEREELSALYESGLSLSDIGDHLGLGEFIIAKLCREYGIETKPNGWNGGQRFLCQDGHLVRSSYEQRVDDWLCAHGVKHTYEPPLPCDRRYRADFLANGWYIEIWGVTANSMYKQRMQVKRQLYRQHDYPLIEIGKSLFSTRDQKLLANRLGKILMPPTPTLWNSCAP